MFDREVHSQNCTCCSAGDYIFHIIFQYEMIKKCRWSISK